jgi:hypothetical protein
MVGVVGSSPIAPTIFLLNERFVDEQSAFFMSEIKPVDA